MNDLSLKLEAIQRKIVEKIEREAQSSLYLAAQKIAKKVEKHFSKKELPGVIRNKLSQGVPNVLVTDSADGNVILELSDGRGLKGMKVSKLSKKQRIKLRKEVESVIIQNRKDIKDEIMSELI